MKFPKVISHRKEEATIYGKSDNYPYYRLAYYVAGKRRVRSFATYSEAKQEAERVVRELADGSQATALTSKQSQDALAALERLESYRKATGKHISLLAAVCEFTDNALKLSGRSLGDAVEGFLKTVATVQRKDITEAVEEFIASRKHKTEAKEGKRAQLSSVYAYNVAMWLREFAKTFPATGVNELIKDHLETYIKQFAKLSSKSRNDRRAVVKMFLQWCVRKDLLPATHRLFEADCMAREIVDGGETDFYTPEELQKLLNAAECDLLPFLALWGLAGIRREEIFRLEWSDVWHVPGHIEINAQKSKTRQRRLVEMVPTLVQWIEPYREFRGKVWTKSVDTLEAKFAKLRKNVGIPARDNGLRHGFCTYHFALHANENLTSAQAGNTPQMLHSRYKGLATKAEAEKWFNVCPKRAENVVPLKQAAHE